MPQMQDLRGVDTTASSAAALDLYETALSQLQSYKGDPVDTIDKAIAEDPGFVMAHCLRAHCGCAMADGRFSGHVEESLEGARSAAKNANDREKLHLSAIEAWHAGEFKKYVNLLESVLIQWPRDVLALQVAHLGDFYLGDSQNLRDRVARAISQYDEDTPGYGYVLGMYSFGLEECNEYSRAEEVGRRAVELNPADVWAIHAVAHVLEMQGRQNEGIDWYESRLEDWAPDNEFATHNWWHLALYNLDLQKIDRVLEIYDASIADGSVALELLDASALLWRLHLMKIDVGNRWDALANKWAKSVSDGGYYCFNDFHALMAFIAAGRNAETKEVIQLLEKSAQGENYSALMARAVGLPLARALVAFNAENYAESTELLSSVRFTANRFGGSHAQRDLISQTLIESAIRAGQFPYARALLSERAERKDTAPLTWQNSARVLDELNLHDQAEAARERVRVLMN